MTYCYILESTTAGKIDVTPDQRSLLFRRLVTNSSHPDFSLVTGEINVLVPEFSLPRF